MHWCLVGNYEHPCPRVRAPHRAARRRLFVGTTTSSPSHALKSYRSRLALWLLVHRARDETGNLAISFASTPLVQPNPTCNKYSPPPPPPLPRCSDGSRSTSYFSISTPASA